MRHVQIIATCFCGWKRWRFYILSECTEKANEDIAIIGNSSTCLGFRWRRLLELVFWSLVFMCILIAAIVDLCNNWIRATVFDWWDVRYRGPPSLSNTATASPNSLQLFIYSNTCCLSSIECVAPSILPTHKIRFEHSLPTSASVTVHFYTSFIINFRFEWRI